MTINTEPDMEAGGPTESERPPLPNDPWKHRSYAMRCQTCMFFVRKMASKNVKIIGRCRRHAPTINGFPAVYPDDWCGDHKIDEEKI